MPDPDQPSRISPHDLEEAVLSSLGESSADPGLGERALVEDPDADERVLRGGRGGAGPSSEELPGEAGAAGADLVEEVVVLEGAGTGNLLDGGLDRLLDDSGGLGEGLGQRLHVERHAYLGIRGDLAGDEGEIGELVGRRLAGGEEGRRRWGCGLGRLELRRTQRYLFASRSYSIAWPERI